MLHKQLELIFEQMIIISCGSWTNQSCVFNMLCVSSRVPVLNTQTYMSTITSWHNIWSSKWNYGHSHLIILKWGTIVPRQMARSWLMVDDVIDLLTIKWRLIDKNSPIMGGWTYTCIHQGGDCRWSSNERMDTCTNDTSICHLHPIILSVTPRLI